MESSIPYEETASAEESLLVFGLLAVLFVLLIVWRLGEIVLTPLIKAAIDALTGDPI